MTPMCVPVVGPSKDQAMKDTIGQEINVGDMVAHSGGQSAGIHVYLVTKITEKRVTVDTGTLPNPSLDPRTLINVTNNLVLLEGNYVLAEKKAVEENIRDARLLQCLEAAGIDNCDAYSFGFAEFAEQEEVDRIANEVIAEADGVIHLWSEGYCVQGNQSDANFLGTYQALTKSDAFNQWADKQDAYTQNIYVDRDRETYYGCRTFDTEADARKSFG